MVTNKFNTGGGKLVCSFAIPNCFVFKIIQEVYNTPYKNTAISILSQSMFLPSSSVKTAPMRLYLQTKCRRVSLACRNAE